MLPSSYCSHPSPSFLLPKKSQAMTCHHRDLLLLLPATLAIIWAVAAQNNPFPISCTNPSSTPSCAAFLYTKSRNLSVATLAATYSANASLARSITRPSGDSNFLLQVPCTCTDAGGGTTALFHDTTYHVVAGDTANYINSKVFSNLAWNIDAGLQAGQLITVHLPCSCLSGTNMQNSDAAVVTYAVEKGDTLSAIADMFSADVDKTVNMNSELLVNPDLLNPGWVLFVPMGTASPATKGNKKVSLALGISIPVVLFILCLLILLVGLLIRSRRRHQVEESKKMVKRSISKLESQFNPDKKLEEGKGFESERPVIFSLKEVEGATANFDDSRVIGVGGFGSVYYGMLCGQEVAVKKMKSNKSQEFFAELKVLCKIHHINVVELIGYASSDDHLYLVYEFLQNGSLSDHLHDPLLRGHQPLSWTARAQIALDAARGIEYIHDHTKFQYVHRDIKTSNILLDNGLRAKVGDFGLAKLVERSSEDDFIPTRLVGTPGYLPPESLLDYQASTKTDVFAFGVMAAELITGYRALIRDNKESTKMKSLVAIMKATFNEKEPEKALETIVDGNLKDSFPMEAVFKVAEIASWCLNDDPSDRPQMSEITVRLSQILMASIEWEASLGGSDEVFSGVNINGR